MGSLVLPPNNILRTAYPIKVNFCTTQQVTRVPPRPAPPVSERSAPQSAGQSAPPSPEGPQPAKRGHLERCARGGAKGAMFQGRHMPTYPARASTKQRLCSPHAVYTRGIHIYICVATSPASSCLLSALTCWKTRTSPPLPRGMHIGARAQVRSGFGPSVPPKNYTAWARMSGLRYQRSRKRHSLNPFPSTEK